MQKEVNTTQLLKSFTFKQHFKLVFVRGDSIIRPSCREYFDLTIVYKRCFNFFYAFKYQNDYKIINN